MVTASMASSRHSLTGPAHCILSTSIQCHTVDVPPPPIVDVPPGKVLQLWYLDPGGNYYIVEVLLVVKFYYNIIVE